MSQSEYDESFPDSRSDSRASEEMALENGRLAMDGIAFAASQLTTEESQSLFGGEDDHHVVSRPSRTRYTLADSFPLLLNLFTYTGNEIVVDEEDASREDSPISDIFLWRFPSASVVWFCTLQVTMFLLLFCDYSLLTIVMSIGLWQLFVDVGFIKIVPWLQARKVVPADFDVKDWVRKNTFFNQALVKNVGGFIHEVADMTIGMWRVLVLEANVPQLLVAMRFMFLFFFRSFSFPITLWLLAMVFFTIPVSYGKNRVFADALAAGAHFFALNKMAALQHRLRRWSATAYNNAKATNNLALKLIWQGVKTILDRFIIFNERLLGA